MKPSPIIPVATSMCMLIACAPMGGEGSADPTGKAGTGYVSDRAIEVNGTVASVVTLTVGEGDSGGANSTPEERYARDLITDRVGRDPEGWRPKDASGLAREQLGYAFGQLLRGQLRITYPRSGGGTRFSPLPARRYANHLELPYEYSVQALVELDQEDEELDEQILFGSHTLRLPADPNEDLFGRYGSACAEGFHDYGETLSAHNYPFWFSPGQESCATAGLETVQATVTLERPTPIGEVFPEYDRLRAPRTAEGKPEIRAVVFFGREQEGTRDLDVLPEDDAGAREANEFRQELVGAGFALVGVADEIDQKGDRFQRERAGVLEVVNVIGPDVLPRPIADRALFGRLVSSNEIVFINGHSFYGTALYGDEEAYGYDGYQIVMLNTCDSYQRYVWDLLEAKATQSGGTGWELVDVVTTANTNRFPHCAEVSFLLLTWILGGTEAEGQSGDQRYDWLSIVTSMNTLAERLFERYQGDAGRAFDHAEVFGVSGVSNNSFRPEGG